jgi:hypothetical protein
VSLQIEKEKKIQKFPQKIWLDVETFEKILALSRQLGVAPNVVCSKIISTYLTNNNEPIEKKIEKITVKEKVVICPSCLKEFQDLSSLTEHLKSNPNEILSFIRKYSLI